ncbi:MAG: hypothetical protein ABIN94_16160 [Ferruginibacter sp.]
MQGSLINIHIKSLAGVLPIMLGDPRKLSSTDLKIPDLCRLVTNNGEQTPGYELPGKIFPNLGNLQKVHGRVFSVSTPLQSPVGLLVYSGMVHWKIKDF